jgi:hypothetical protein
MWLAPLPLWAPDRLPGLPWEELVQAQGQGLAQLGLERLVVSVPVETQGLGLPALVLSRLVEAYFRLCRGPAILSSAPVP